MTTKVFSTNIDKTIIEPLLFGPYIANVQYLDAGASGLDDKAVPLAGGNIQINGFRLSNVSLKIAGNTIPSANITVVDDNTLTLEVGAAAAGTYTIVATDTETGDVGVYLNGITYSTFPAWSTDSTLADVDNDIAFSVQLSANSDSSIEYTLADGSSLPANVALAANGLLSGTITAVSETTYNFTVVATDRELQNTNRTFSVTVTFGDEFFKSTSLLLNADNNTFITDASDNAFDVTPNGDVRPSAFSPYNTSWSNYFDGSGDYLSFGDNLDIVANDFTFECFVYFSSINNTYNAIFSKYGSSYSYQFLWDAPNNRWFWNVNNGASTTVTFSDTIVANQWYYLCLERTGTSYKLYRDGSQIGTTQTISGNIADGTRPFVIGYTFDGSNNALYPLNGYVSNFRAVIGSNVYGSAPSIPTAPLTAVSGTSLLTCQSNRLVDNSTNNFTITKNGDTKVTAFGPFAETDTSTGSGYFDGTGDYLTIPDTPDLEFGSENFTIEAWIYPTTTVGANRPIWGHGTDSSNWMSLYLHTTAGRPEFSIISGGSVIIDIFPSDVISTNTWYHIAVVRNGSTFTMYLNGTSIGTGTSSSAVPDFADAFRVGFGRWNGDTGVYQGYIDDLRITRGVARYTENFTPPTAPLTAISGTSLLTLQNRIGYNNSQPIDESGIKNIITRNGNASVGTFSPHVPTGWSGYFDGSGDYITIAPNSAMSFGTADFTIEFWMNSTVFSRDPYDRRIMRCVANFNTGAGAGFGIGLNGNPSGGIGQIGFGTEGSGGASVSSSGTVCDGEWHHIACGVKNGNVILYVDGVFQAQAATTVNVTDPASYNTHIGWFGYAQGFYSGYLSDIRITKGEFLYDENFTPSTTPTTLSDKTVFSLLQTPYLQDYSAVPKTLTRAGDTKITPFSPFTPHTITPDSHSVYFDGSGDYLEIANDDALHFPTEDFTWEFWANWPAFPGSGAADSFFYKGYGSTNQMEYGARLNNVSGSLTLEFAYTNNGSTIVNGISYVASLSTGTWYHIAVTRVGSEAKLYLDGQLVQTGTWGTDTYDAGTQPLQIGTIASGTHPYYGYISNLRFVKGTAVYTSNFTPPTSPLTAISGTSLLTCQSPTVIDNSTNEFAITVNGNSQPTKFNPFGETVTTGVEYSPVSHGGSIYNDGTSDSIKIPHSEEQTLRDGDFTIEFWFYPTATLGNGACLLTKGWGSYAPYLFYVSGANILFYASANGSSWNVSNAQIIGAYQVNAWNHITVTRNGTSFRGFMNGVAGFSITSSATLLVNTTTVTLGAADNNSSAGPVYYHGLRILKGAALYTSAFVPPAAPVTPIPSTTLLINGNNAAIQDKTGRNVLETVGDARVVNGVKKYGSGAMYFDGTGDYLVNQGDIENFRFGTGDFAIEFWLYTFNLGPSADVALIDFRPSGPVNGAYPYLYIYQSKIRFWFNTAERIIQSDTLIANEWYHVALTRSGTDNKLFVNGVQKGSTYSNQDNCSVGASRPVIGVNTGLGAAFNGYIDDLRITRGVARYTANFTPPTSAHKTK